MVTSCCGGTRCFCALLDGTGTRIVGTGGAANPFKVNLEDSVFNANDYGVEGTLSAVQAAVVAAHASWLATGKGGAVLLTGGDWFFNNDTLELPSFTVTGNSWDMDNPIKIYGIPGMTRIHYTGTDYAIAHPTITTTSNRGQNYGVTISGLTFYGPQDFSKAASAIGIDNTRMADINNNSFFGFPGGTDIHIRGYQKGGSFQARIWQNMFGNNEYTQSGANVLSPSSLLEKWGSRYNVWLDGPYNSTGKVNDTLLKDNRYIDFLIGAVKIEGTGLWTPGPNTGGSANTNSTGNVLFTQEARKMEEGGLFSVASTTVMRLRQSDCLTEDLTGFNFGWRDPDGRMQHRYIDSYNVGTREVTLDGALPSLPVANDDYRIGYADAAARAVFTDPTTLQHAFYWASAFNMRSSEDYFEEAIAVVAHPDASSGVTIIAPDDSVNDSRYGMRVDGSVFHPRLVVSAKPRGSDATPASISTTDGLLIQPDDIDGEWAWLGAMPNETGGRVYVGDTVRISNTYTAVASSSSGGVTTAHVVVWSNSRAFFEDGEELTYVLVGRVKVSVSAAVSTGDVLRPATGNRAIGSSSATVTLPQLSFSIGKALTSAGSGAKVMAHVRAL